MSASCKWMCLTLSCLLLAMCLVTSARADTIENLSFDGFATCGDSHCTSFGSGPVSGTYSLDVTTQTIVGPWSFNTPLGIMASSTAGANSSVTDRFGDINPGFAESTPFEFIQFFFPGADTQEIGALATNITSDACTPASASSCFPDYAVTGVNQLTSSYTTPEPSNLVFLGFAAAALVVAGRRKKVLERG